MLKMNDLTKDPTGSVPEFESVMKSIRCELDVAEKTSEVLYQAVCRLHEFGIKESEPIKSEMKQAENHLNNLREVNNHLNNLNYRNNEIVSKLITLI